MKTKVTIIFESDDAENIRSNIEDFLGDSPYPHELKVEVLE